MKYNDIVQFKYLTRNQEWVNIEAKESIVDFSKEESPKYDLRTTSFGSLLIPASRNPKKILQGRYLTNILSVAT